MAVVNVKSRETHPVTIYVEQEGELVCIKARNPVTNVDQYILDVTPAGKILRVGYVSSALGLELDSTGRVVVADD
jgi:hypothetical protein